MQGIHYMDKLHELICNKGSKDKIGNEQFDFEVLFKKLFQHTSEGIALIDDQGNITSANPKYIQILEDQLKSQASISSDSKSNPTNLLPCNITFPKNHKIASAWTGIVSHCYSPALKVDIKTTIVPHDDINSQIMGYLLLISEPELNSDSSLLLEANETHLRQIISNYPQPIIVIDKNHRVVQWNSACEQFIGLTEEEMIGTNDQWKAFYPSKRPIMADIILDGGSQALMSEFYQGKYKKSRFVEGTYEAEDFFPHMGKNGRWLYFTASAIKDSDGTVIGAIESLIDITERKQAEAEVQLLNIELNQLIETYPQPILVLNKNHEITHWNRASERVLGFAAEEMIGTKNQWKPFYPSERPIMADMVMEHEGGLELIQSFYSGKYRQSPFIPGAFECEDYFPNMKSKNQDQEGRWLHFTASAIRNESGEIVGAIESLIDVSERKEAESEVRKLNDELEQRVLKRTSELNQANADLHKAMTQLVNAEKLASLGSLVAGIAHELNTPIGNINTVSSTLQEKASEFDQVIKSGTLKKSVLVNFLQVLSDSTQLMQKSSYKAAELISHFKQVAVDQTSVRRRKFDLQETINETITSLGPTLKKTNYELKAKIPECILMDSFPGPIEQIFTNLVHNSLMHGFEHREHGSISIECRIQDSEVIMIYKDDGIGIPEDIHKKAFDPFFTTKLGSGGSGLGLYIIYNLVTVVLGGEIELESNVGDGVEFCITLPLEAPYSQKER